MPDDILISAGLRRHRIAVVQDGRLIELHLGEADTATSAPLPERIILGRVKTIQGDLDAAFVDIGEERDALLPARDAAAKRGTAIAKAVQQGQSLVVQVKREAEDEKGARISARPRLKGRALVLLPLGQDIELSRHIKDGAQRQRLQHLGPSLRDDERGGLILRSAAEKTSDAELRAEAAALWQQWRDIQAAAQTAKPPARLAPGDDPIGKILRERSGASLGRICVDDAALAGELRQTLRKIWGDGAPVIEVHDNATPLFDEHDLEGQIETALSLHARLPSGGRIIIEHTQALTAIDVDSAQATSAGDAARLAQETNLEAAREVARQLRLREIGGRVVIDFIPMHGKGQATDLLARFRRWLADDPGQVRLGAMSEMGLVELTRRRQQPALALRLGEACPHCQGRGLRPTPRAVADNLLQRILREADVAKGRVIAVRAAPAVVADLGGSDGEVLTMLAKDRGCRVDLRVDDTFALETFEVTTPR
ncbi:MAG: ribonuclease E/G [Alphaproteobacteria bacterium]|nr:ribonuclease E/G [Alphaproteobacteria bacterium]